MNEHAPDLGSFNRPLRGRALTIAAIGAIGFNVELGPNAHVPEVLEPAAELPDETPIPVEVQPRND